MNGGITRLKALVLIFAALLLLSPTVTTAATCNSVSACTKEQQRLRQQQQEAKQNFDKNRRQAQDLQGVISELQEDIGYTENRIGNTEDQIRVTDQILNQLTGTITTTEKRLSAAYVSLYELSRTSGTQLIFNANFNDTLSQAQYIQAIQSQLQKEIDELHQSKSEREQQKSSLEGLKTQLEDERSSLATKKSRQTHLLSVAESNASYYQSLGAEIQKKIAEVERQINTLLSKSSWGSDIVSVSDPSWYYRQLDYPNVRLGSSPYTVAQYGCLVTSYSMVSTYYGNRLSPPQIAGIASNFNSGGSLVKEPPSPVGLSMTRYSGASGKVKLFEEASAGRPVIVSIYLPDVGALNSDGSSHFVVVYGMAGNRYIMQDPLGPGRSYALSQVKTVKVIRN